MQTNAMPRDRSTPSTDGPTVDPSVIENEKRRRLFEAVLANPGAGLADLAEASGLGYSTARYHLHVLRRAGRVSTAKLRGKRRAFPPSVDAPALAAALDDDATAVLIVAVARLGPSPVSRLADALDKDPSTVTYHAKRLESDGLVTRRRRGRYTVIRLDPDVERALTDPGLPRRSGPR